MAATAGNLVFIGKSGKKYCYDVYVPDATGTALVFNGTGLAVSTGNSQLVLPEDGAVTEYITMTTAPTAVGFSISLNSAVIHGGVVRHGNVLSTLATRVTQFIPARQGDILTATQF